MSFTLHPIHYPGEDWKPGLEITYEFHLECERIMFCPDSFYVVVEAKSNADLEAKAITCEACGSPMRVVQRVPIVLQQHWDRWRRRL